MNPAIRQALYEAYGRELSELMEQLLTGEVVSDRAVPEHLVRHLATQAVNTHTNDAGLCAASGSVWLCERAVLAEHNLASAL